MIERQQAKWDDVKGRKELVQAINDAGNRTSFEWIVGNHDYTLHTVPDFYTVFPNVKLYPPRLESIILRKKVGQQTSPKTVIKGMTSGGPLEIFGLNVFMRHGSEYSHYFARNPRKHERIIKAAGVLEKILGGNADDDLQHAYEWIRNFIGLDSDMSELGKQLQLAARDLAMYEIDGGRIVKRQKKDYPNLVIFGHSHQQKMIELCDDVLEETDPIGTIYVDTGCWVKTRYCDGADFTVLYKNGRCANYKWTMNGPELQKEIVLKRVT